MIETNTSASASTNNGIRAKAAEAENIASLTRLMRGSRSFNIDLNGVKLRRDTVSIAFGSRLFAEAESQKAVQGNAREAASLLQTADAALSEISDRLDQLKSLAAELNTAGSTFSTQERAEYENQLFQLRSEIDTIAADAEFNGVKLLEGGSTPGQPLNLDVRVSADAGGEDISISIGAAAVADLSTDLSSDTFSTSAGATATETHIDAAINALDGIRARVRADSQSLGAVAQRAEIAATEADELGGQRAAVQVDIDLSRLVSQQIVKEGNISLTDPEAELLRIGLRNANSDYTQTALKPSSSTPQPAPDNAPAPAGEFPPELDT